MLWQLLFMIINQLGCHQMTCRTSVQCIIIDSMCDLPTDVYAYQSQSES